MDSTTLDKKSGKITYTRNYNITPFVFSKFPHELDKYCIIILGKASNVTKNLLQYILNSYIDENIIEAKSLYTAQKQVSDLSETHEQLKRKVAIFDISVDNSFTSLHSKIIAVNENRSWLDIHILKNILMPNNLLNSGNNKEDASKNYSHTIWLASDLDDIPKVLLTNFHLLFIMEKEQITDYFNRKLDVAYMASDDIIFVISSILKENTQLMTMKMDRFL